MQVTLFSNLLETAMEPPSSHKSESLSPYPWQWPEWDGIE